MDFSETAPWFFRRLITLHLKKMLFRPDLHKEACGNLNINSRVQPLVFAQELIAQFEHFEVPGLVPHLFFL